MRSDRSGYDEVALSPHDDDLIPAQSLTRATDRDRGRPSLTQHDIPLNPMSSDSGLRLNESDVELGSNVLQSHSSHSVDTTSGSREREGTEREQLGDPTVTNTRLSSTHDYVDDDISCLPSSWYQGFQLLGLVTIAVLILVITIRTSGLEVSKITISSPITSIIDNPSRGGAPAPGSSTPAVEIPPKPVPVPDVPNVLCSPPSGGDNAARPSVECIAAAAAVVATTLSSSPDAVSVARSAQIMGVHVDVGVATNATNAAPAPATASSLIGSNTSASAVAKLVNAAYETLSMHRGYRPNPSHFFPSLNMSALALAHTEPSCLMQTVRVPTSSIADLPLPATEVRCISGFSSPPSAPMSHPELPRADTTCELRNVYVQNGRLYSYHPTDPNYVKTLLDAPARLVSPSAPAATSPSHTAPANMWWAYDAGRKKPQLLGSAFTHLVETPLRNLIAGAPVVLRSPRTQLVLPGRLPYFREKSVDDYAYSPHALVDLIEPALFALHALHESSPSTHPPFDSCAQALVTDKGSATTAAETLWPVLLGGGAKEQFEKERSRVRGAEVRSAAASRYKQGPGMDQWLLKNETERAKQQPDDDSDQALYGVPRTPSTVPELGGVFDGFAPAHSLEEACPRDAVCLLQRVVVPSPSYGFYHHHAADFAWKERTLLKLRLYVAERMGLYSRTLSIAPPLPVPSTPSTSSLPSTASASSPYSPSHPFEIIVFSRTLDETGTHCPNCCFRNHLLAVDTLATAFPFAHVRTAVPRHQSFREQLEQALSGAVFVGVDGGAFELHPFVRANAGFVLSSRWSGPSAAHPNGLEHFNHDGEDAAYVAMWRRRIHVEKIHSVKVSNASVGSSASASASPSASASASAGVGAGVGAGGVSTSSSATNNNGNSDLSQSSMCALEYNVGELVRAVDRIVEAMRTSPKSELTVPTPS